MIAILAWAATALATTLDSPVATNAHGNVRVAMVAAGEGTLRRAAKLPDHRLRLDAMPMDGVGIWATAGWYSGAPRNGHRDLGWSVGTGGRATDWITRGLAVGASAGIFSGGRWTTGDEVQREVRFSELAGTPVLVVGPKGGGAYAWGGPAVALRAVAPAADEAVDWAAATGGLGLEIGGELHSSDLIGPGDPRRAHLSIGAGVHAVDTFRISIWMGVGW